MQKMQKNHLVHSAYRKLEDILPIIIERNSDCLQRKIFFAGKKDSSYKQASAEYYIRASWFCFFSQLAVRENCRRIYQLSPSVAESIWLWLRDPFWIDFF